VKEEPMGEDRCEKCGHYRPAAPHRLPPVFDSPCQHYSPDPESRNNCSGWAEPLPVSVLDLVRLYHGITDKDTPISGGQCYAAGFEILGGCEICGATISAGNGYPSHSGFWRCSGCIEDTGWESLQKAAEDLFGWPSKVEKYELDAQYEALADADRQYRADVERELAEEEPESQPRVHR